MIKLETIGADPEFALINSEKKPIGSFIFFEGTKRHPEYLDSGYALLKDNLLIEGNIPPCQSKDEFITSMSKIKQLILDRVSASNSSILFTDKVEFSDEFIFTEDGLEFGCSSYIDVYREEIFPTPELEGNERTVGAHIHIGYQITDYSKDISDMEFNFAIGKAMDFFLGIPSDQIHECKSRRKTYGKLGSIRNTAYGLEYRALGGFFLQDEFLEWQYDQTKKAIEFVANEENFDKLKAVTSADEKYYDFLGIDISKQIPTKKLVKI